MKKFFGWALCLLLFSSCSHKFVRPQTDPNPAAFAKDQQKREKLFRYLQGKLDLRFKSPKFKVSGAARLFVGEKGETRLEIVDPLGRTQFIGHLAGRAFLAYWPRQERAYRDFEEGRHYLYRYLGLSLTFRELVDLFWGLVPRAHRMETPSVSSKGWGFDEETGYFLATLGQGEKGAGLGWSLEQGAVGSLQWTTPGQGILLKAQWEDFSPFTDMGQTVPLANQVSVQSDSQDILLAVSWNDVESKTKTDFGNSLAPQLSDKTKVLNLP